MPISLSKPRLSSLFSAPPKPPEVSAADRDAYERKIKDEQSKWPRWKRLAADIPYGIGKGLLGEPPERTGFSNMNDADKTNMIIQGIMSAAPILGVTKYLQAGKGLSKIPNVAGRVAGTEEFVNNMKKIGPQFHVAGEQFASKYPRIAAHMAPEAMSPDVMRHNPNLQGSASTHLMDVTTPIKLRPNATNPMNTIAHEGTHVAQALGMGKEDFNKIYHLSTKQVGYTPNPAEISARDIGDKFSHSVALKSSGIDPKKLGWKTRGMKDELNKMLAQPTNSPTAEAARNEIKDVLNARQERIHQKEIADAFFKITGRRK